MGNGNFRLINYGFPHKRESGDRSKSCSKGNNLLPALSALRTPHSALRGLISKSPVPTAPSWRRLARFASVVISLIFLVPLQAQADADICGPESTGSHALLQQKPEWYSDKLKELEIVYSNVHTELERAATRNKYIDMRLEIDEENFRKFASDICARGINLSVSGSAEVTFKIQKKSYSGFEAMLIFKKLQALHSAKIAKTKAAMRAAKQKNDKAYSLMDAKQELLDLDWTLMLYTAINEVEKIKLEAMEKAASGVPAN